MASPGKCAPGLQVFYKDLFTVIWRNPDSVEVRRGVQSAVVAPLVEHSNTLYNYTVPIFNTTGPFTMHQSLIGAERPPNLTMNH